MTLTTSGPAAPGSRVFVYVLWNNATQTFSSVSGGGLTWTVDGQVRNTSDYRLGIASAAAPLGLATGTVLTATFSGSVTHGLIASASFLGLAASSPLDASASSTQGGVVAWSANVTTTNPTDLVLGWSTIDANATSTPTAPNTEIHDFGDANFYGWATSVYRIESTAGVKTVNGTWSRNTGATANGTLAIAYKAG
jgi:hypothetical protein